MLGAWRRARSRSGRRRRARRAASPTCSWCSTPRGRARRRRGTRSAASGGWRSAAARRAIWSGAARGGPFLAVNCGALPKTLIESELFGFKKGAFSGANEDRAGVIRAAEGGTLFLDEIGELPPAAQAALLRVLQEREVMPIGATRAI